MPVSAHVHPYRPPRVAGATGQSVVGRGGGGEAFIAAGTAYSGK